MKIVGVCPLTHIRGSHESYVRAVLAPAVTPKSEGGLGFRGVVVNFRGCKSTPVTSPATHCQSVCTGAGVPITSPQLYSAGHTEDYRAAILYVRMKYPMAPLLGIGFSLGANVITRYVAEEGDKCRLVSAVALGCVRIYYRAPRADVNAWQRSHGTYAKMHHGEKDEPFYYYSSLTMSIGSRVVGSTVRFIPRPWVATSNLSSGGTGKHWQSLKTTPSRLFWTRCSA